MLAMVIMSPTYWLGLVTLISIGKYLLALYSLLDSIPLCHTFVRKTYGLCAVNIKMGKRQTLVITYTVMVFKIK